MNSLSPEPKICNFPYVSYQADGKVHEAAVAIKMNSLLKGNLLLDQHFDGNKQHMEMRLQKQRAGLLQALSAWPSNVTLELHFFVNPLISNFIYGQVIIFLILRAKANDELKAKEIVVQKYLILRPFLSNFWSEAEFQPVISRQEFDYLSAPCNAQYALSIQHLEEMVILSKPIQNRVTGFSGFKEAPENSPVVPMRFPWSNTLDDWSNLFNVLMGQMDPLEIVVRIQPVELIKADLQYFEDSLKACDDLLASNPNLELTLKQQTQMIRETLLDLLRSIQGNAFLIGTFLISEYPLDIAIGQLVGQAISGPLAVRQEKNRLEGGFSIQHVPADEVRNMDFFPDKFPCSPFEAAYSFRLPSPPLVDLFGIPLKRSRTNMITLPPLEEHGKYFQELFVNDHAGNSQSIRIPLDIRMHHMFLLGQTGTGKSTILEHMILQDIVAGIGVGVIDPEGDLVNKILGKIPIERIHDVILLDLLDHERPIGLNILQVDSWAERDLIIDELYMILDRIYNFALTGGPVFEHYFRGMLKLLIGPGNRPNFSPTILEFVQCFINQKFRAWLIDTIDDETLRDFVREIESSMGDISLPNVGVYITSKLNRFIHNDSVKRIVGQNKTTISFDTIMNQQKILLVNLRKGSFGSITSAFIANYLVSCFKKTAMKRGEIPAKERKDFALYVDECNNLPAENFTELLSEARKYRMSLTLATQYASQIAKQGGNTSSLLSAVLGNVGSLVMLRLGLEDGVLVESVLKPSFSKLDITSVPNWSGYARIQAGGYHGFPFSFKTVKNQRPYKQSVAERIIKNSRESYGTPSGLVDAQIAYRKKPFSENSG